MKLGRYRTPSTRVAWCDAPKEHLLNMELSHSRRGVLTGMMAVAAGVAAVACGSGNTAVISTVQGTPAAGGQSGGTAAAQPRRGGQLRINQTGDIVLSAGYPYVVAPQNGRLPWFLHEALIRYRKDVQTPELVLAERFEYNADRTKLLVTIKQGATFHNGAPVTAEDVFFGIDFNLDPKRFGVTLAGVTNQLARAITERKKIDDRTMEFTFDRPRHDMTGFFLTLYVTHAASFPKLLTGESVQGTGPYQLKNWTPNVGYTLTRNPSWHLTAKEGGPYLDEIAVKVFTDESAAATAFAAGDLDIAFRLTGAEAKRFRNRVKTAPRIGGLILDMVVKNPLLADKRVRQALFLAIDKERLAKELGEGFFQATSQLWPEYSPAYDKALDVPSYDPQRAKALLKEAGFSQSKPLDLEYSGRSTQNAAVLKANFEAVGVQVNLVPVDAVPLVNRLRNRQVTDLVISGTNLTDPVPGSALQKDGNINIPNVSGYESPELADILKGLATADPLGPEAKTLYARFNKLWLDDPWVVPLEPSGALDAVGPKVAGFDEYFIQPLQAPNFGRIWLKE